MELKSLKGVPSIYSITIIFGVLYLGSTFGDNILSLLEFNL